MPQRNRTPAQWWRIENVADEVADLYIYDVIGADFWGEGIAAREFVPALNALDVKTITLHLNSPGGDVFDAVAIHNALRAHPATVTARIEGIAASAASFVAMAADKVVLVRSATMMIHEAQGLVMGPASDMRKMADTLDGLSQTIADIYAAKAGGTQASWLKAMAAETWYSDKKRTGFEDAMASGLVDEIDSKAAAPKNAFDLSHFRNVPDSLAAKQRDAQEPTEATARREVDDRVSDERAQTESLRLRTESQRLRSRARELQSVA